MTRLHLTIAVRLTIGCALIALPILVGCAMSLYALGRVRADIGAFLGASSVAPGQGSPFDDRLGQSSAASRQFAQGRSAPATRDDTALRAVSARIADWLGVILLAGLAALLAVGGFLGHLWRSIVRRLALLEQATVAEGIIDVSGGDELTATAQAIQNFHQALRERERALLATENRLGSVTANLPAVIFRLIRRWDGALILTYLSPGGRDLLGPWPADLLTRPNAVFDLFPPAEAGRFRAALDHSAAAGSQLVFEYRARKAAEDGAAECWLRILSHPRPDSRDHADQGIRGDVVWDGLILDSTAWKQADLAKRAFVSTVSHELRTPLTSIQGSLGLVAGGAMGQLPEGAKRLVAIANTNCQRLTRLINDILNIEKIEAGQIDFNLKRVPLAPLLQQAVDANRGYGIPRGVRLLLHEPLPDVQITVDIDRFIQIMANLLSNAVKYSPDEGVVEITARYQGRDLRIAVIDHGPGIPQAFRANVFERFTQADSSDRRAIGGTGLGLSIAKAIVERLNGEIGFVTELGQGTEFYVVLPVTGALPDPIRPCLVVASLNSRLIRPLGQWAAVRGMTLGVATRGDTALALLAEASVQGIALDLGLGDDGFYEVWRGVGLPAVRAGLPVILLTGNVGAEGGMAIRLLDLMVVSDGERDGERDGGPVCRPLPAGRLLFASADEQLLGRLSGLDSWPDSNGGQLTLARTGLAALHHLQGGRFDAIILDLDLGLSEAPPLLRRIAEDRVNGQVPILMIARTEKGLASRLSAALGGPGTNLLERLAVLLQEKP